MQKHFVRVAMGFTYGFLFCILFGTIGLGINTGIDHSQSATEVKAIEGDTVSVFSESDLAVVTIFTNEGLTLSHNYQEFSFPAGTTNTQIEPGEYIVLIGTATISSHFGDTLFNVDDFFRKMDTKRNITVVSLLLGIVVGFLIGIMLASEEKPRQKFICE